MKMNKAAALLFSIALGCWTQGALAQANASKAAALEAFFCNFQPGKGMKDLMAVANTFNKWASKNDPGYSAWILTPDFGQFATLPQVVWLGSNASGNEMGKGLDGWKSSGNDIQKDFDSVIACGSHSVASSVEINAPDGPPGDGVVMFSQCSIAEGSDWQKAIAAHKKYATAMRGLGTKGSNWLFFPMIGAPAEMPFDYWGVSTFKSWTDYFSAYEIYVNGGGWQKAMESMQGAASCAAGSPSVWSVKLVRQGEQS